MAQLRVTCPHCGRLTLVDADKVPDQPVSFKCPSCQGKVALDKRRLLQGGGESAAALAGIESAAKAAATVASSTTAPGGSGTPSTAAGAAGGAPPAAADPPVELTLPPGAALPPCVIVAEDREAATQLQQVLEPFDGEVEIFADVAAARERLLLEPPPLVVWAAGAVAKPPHPPLDAFAALPPRERRAIVLVLLADNVKTLDGNLAFLYNVDLLLGRRHLPQAPGILYAALRAHQRLYRPFLAASGE